MKKKLCMLLFISILIVSCTNFDETICINPKVHLVGDIIGLEYTIYGKRILDEIRGASPMMVKYFVDNEDNLNLRLHIFVEEKRSTKTYFTYYIGGVKICRNINVLSLIQIKRIQADLKNKKLMERSVKNNQIKNTPSPSIDPVEQNENITL